jgi:hypothetical protein
LQRYKARPPRYILKFQVRSNLAGSGQVKSSTSAETEVCPRDQVTARAWAGHAAVTQPTVLAPGWWSVFDWRRVWNQRVVEEGHLFGCRCLEYLEPSEHGVPFYRWLLHAAALNPVEEDIWRRGDIM